jgi:osmotically-inducible protein OsmY
MIAMSQMSELEQRARAALATSPFYELRDLRVETNGQTLTISGTVSSFYHKQLAQEVVRSVCQGTAVSNAIRVEQEAELQE